MMSLTSRWAAVIGVASLVLGPGPMAHAQTASALVLESKGATSPALRPYSEVPVDTRVSLAPDARLVFLHYHTCQTVAVVGGTVTFGAATYALTGGRTESEARRPCPRRVKLRAGGEVGGIVLRSAPPPLVLATRPVFVVLGPRAGEFTSVRVSSASQTVLEAPLQGAYFAWPSAAAPLAGDAEYELVLVPAAAAAASVKTRFKTMAAGGGPATDPVLITIE